MTRLRTQSGSHPDRIESLAHEAYAREHQAKRVCAGVVIAHTSLQI